MTEILEEIRARLARLELLLGGGPRFELTGPVDRARRYSVREVGELIAMSRQSVYLAIQTGRLPAIEGPGQLRVLGAALVAFAEGSRGPRPGPMPGRSRTREKGARRHAGCAVEA
ncbi:MAG: helix-turn-helix domain-containing protein [Planctomycetes bacterium]|nr:helix-turn-helix domain-containing protein [Planctomycetota bacterium]